MKKQFVTFLKISIIILFYGIVHTGCIPTHSAERKAKALIKLCGILKGTILPPITHISSVGADISG